MYTAEITFKRRGRRGEQDSESPIWDCVMALERNGQVLDRDHPILTVRGGYRAIVGLPEQTALQASRPSRYVRKSLRALEKCGITISKVRLLGVEAEAGDVCRCRRCPSLILETHLLTVESPLRCGKCFGHVPLYRFPHTDECGTYEDLRGWASRYRALDTLWIDSGVGEQFAYRELSRHDSDLSEGGRDICRRIEKSTGIPTYYSLMRYYARSVASERKRPCPSCGRKWLVEPPWFGRYHFRCDRCGLVSNIGHDVR